MGRQDKTFDVTGLTLACFGVGMLIGYLLIWTLQIFIKTGG